ncbi:hypothetical protein HPP92_020166 [Vanilla planifolia]|uniref:Uncharacterized protein n=1 Tax=Vanilla planifolia TaxID=51239 RepID=A0A835QDY1_VANPL|nr:hypothetical protein HPP92_020166 [Vanilla planifolia]
MAGLVQRLAHDMPYRKVSATYQNREVKDLYHCRSQVIQGRSFRQLKGVALSLMPLIFQDEGSQLERSGNGDAFFYALRFVIMDSQGKKFGRGPRELTGAVDLISHYKLLAHHDFFCIRQIKGIPTSTGKPKEPKDKTKKHKKHKDKDKEKDKEHKKHKHRHKDKSKDKDKEKEKDKIGHHDSSGDHSKKHHEKKRKLEGSEDVTDIHKHKKMTLGAISAGLKEPEVCLFNLSRKLLFKVLFLKIVNHDMQSLRIPYHIKNLYEKELSEAIPVSL